MSTTFEILNKLGEGSFGCVYKAIHKLTNQTVALKQLSIDLKHLEETIEEVAILQQCNCSTIVAYYGSYIIENELWIVMEYCEGGSVSAALKILERNLNEREICAILKDVLNAMDYLHKEKIIHRDIKAANILLKRTDNGCAKLGDLGVCCQLRNGKTKSLVGSPYWMAPEVIAGNDYDCSSDIWSLGITILEMAEGKPPYADINPWEVLFIIAVRPSPFFQKNVDKCSVNFVDLVRLCLIKDPKKRATSQELLNSLKQIDSYGVIIELIDEICQKKAVINFERHLQKLLHELEYKMEKEISELRERYVAKVTPIREAIVKKITKT